MCGRRQDATNTTLFLQGNHTFRSVPPELTLTHQLKYVPTVGVEAGFWWGELLSDPRPVDAFSLVYDSAPLESELAILGRPHALLRASASAPLANWFARLSDVAPDGTVTQITGAGLEWRAARIDERILAIWSRVKSIHLTSKCT